MRKEANLWRSVILSPIPGEGGLQPIVCCQLARSGEGHFSGCLQVVFLAVSPGCFSGCVAKLFSGCVARLFFWLCRQVCYRLCRQVFSGWFCQGLFSDVRQCVIAQDRASQLSSKSNCSESQGDSIYLFIPRDIYGI